MVGEGMAKISIGRLMRKKISDVTDSQPRSKIPIQDEMPPENFPAEKDCIGQLLKEKMTLVQLLAERDKIIDLSGAELRRLGSNIRKLQLLNWNLAQSNSQILAELNLGRERMKAMQHDILCKAALLKGKNLGVKEKVDMDCENNGSVGRPSVKASNEEKSCNRNIRSRSLGSALVSTKDASKDKVENKRQCLSRRSAAATSRRHEHEPLENLFEMEDAKYPVIQSAPNSLKTGENSASRYEAPRSSFGRPLRKAAEKVQPYKNFP